MKRIIAILLTACMGIVSTACAADVTDPDETGSAAVTDVAEIVTSAAESDTPEISDSNTEPSEARVLIAYFSVPENVSTDGVDAVAGASIVVRDGEKLGNTEYVAKLINETVGGELFRIETVEPYPLVHETLVDQASDEKAAAARPELTAEVEDFERYDIILLGYPNWWGDLPMPLYTFLEAYDFSGKTVIPFITHGGSRASRTIETISELQPNANVEKDALILSRGDVADSESTVTEWAKNLGIQAGEALPSGGDTVATAVVTPKEQQVLYLWEENNVPAVTEYTVNRGGYSDDPDFRPYVTFFPVPEDIEIKGAVLICAGGAFQFRSDRNEGSPVAEELSKLGYQSFVVDYRLRPYTQEEGALDLARAVRFVRAHADEFGIDPDDIAVMGFSAGGILAGEMLLNFDGSVDGTALDSNYVPDELDKISADAAADGMIYSFYGRLSVASKDVEKFKVSDLPPTYFCYGTRDPFVGEFEACIEALQEAGVTVEVNVLNGRPHGYGYTEGWILDYDRFLSGVFSNN